MSGSNIERFDDFTGQILGRLYERFPIPTRVAAMDYLDCGPIQLAQNEYAFTGEDAEIFTATAQWLVIAGYIHSEGQQKSYLSKAVLTAKGLELLKMTPSSVKGGRSFGERLISGAKDESRSAFRAVVSELLGLGAKFVSPMIGLTP